jgi:phenylacetic acid degradation protein
MPIYSLQGIIPVVHPGAFVHETAVLIGDVMIGEGCYVAPNAVLRGDFGRIVLEAGSNIQDGCVAHTFPGMDCVVESNGHVGHGAVLHGCRIERNALVGMNSVIMDGAVIATESIVAAMAFVPADFSCEPRSLVVGTPARVMRGLRDEEIAWKSEGTLQYQQLTGRCLDSLSRADPLPKPEPDRRRIQAGDFEPKNRW